MSATPAFFSTIKDAVLKLANATGTAAQDLVAGSTNGLRIKSLIATSTDTSARVLQIIKTVGAVEHVIGEVNVPITAGTDGATPAVNLLDATAMPGLQSDGVQRFIDVANGTTLQIKPKVAVTAGLAINVVAEYGEL